MINLPQAANQIHYVTNFQDFISTPFNRGINAICWTRNLAGDFSDIVDKVELKENIATLDEVELSKLVLSEQGRLAREILLNDLQMLNAHGA